MDRVGASENSNELIMLYAWFGQETHRPPEVHSATRARSVRQRRAALLADVPAAPQVTLDDAIGGETPSGTILGTTVSSEAILGAPASSGTILGAPAPSEGQKSQLRCVQDSMGQRC